ncbi:MAG: hypothetical protein EBR82_37555 [Caulobacteraceae bacterium]|nr:hypothetical protein [Caulobacteraceae bacterium]
MSKVDEKAAAIAHEKVPNQKLTMLMFEWLEAYEAAKSEGERGDAVSSNAVCGNEDTASSSPTPSNWCRNAFDKWIKQERKFFAMSGYHFVYNEGELYKGFQAAWKYHPTAEEVERVADAIYDADATDGQLAITHEHYCQILATAAIKAMRIPPAVLRGLEDSAAGRVRERVEYSLSRCPNCGGVADNGHDRCDPPSPYYCTKCTKPTEDKC